MVVLEVRQDQLVEGSNGDVVTLALEHDISLIEQTGLINKGWQKRTFK